MLFGEIKVEITPLLSKTSNAFMSNSNFYYSMGRYYIDATIFCIVSFKQIYAERQPIIVSLYNRTKI